MKEHLGVMRFDDLPVGRFFFAGVRLSSVEGGFFKHRKLTGTTATLCKAGLFSVFYNDLPHKGEHTINPDCAVIEVGRCSVACPMSLKWGNGIIAKYTIRTGKNSLIFPGDEVYRLVKDMKEQEAEELRHQGTDAMLGFLRKRGMSDKRVLNAEVRAA